MNLRFLFLLCGFITTCWASDEIDENDPMTQSLVINQNQQEIKEEEIIKNKTMLENIEEVKEQEIIFDKPLLEKEKKEQQIILDKNSPKYDAWQLPNEGLAFFCQPVKNGLYPTPVTSWEIIESFFDNPIKNPFTEDLLSLGHQFILTDNQQMIKIGGKYIVNQTVIAQNVQLIIEDKLECQWGHFFSQSLLIVPSALTTEKGILLKPVNKDKPISIFSGIDFKNPDWFYPIQKVKFPILSNAFVVFIKD